ncbi:MAG: hypothetical protein IT232_04695 [Flavobacteriales bacterium]|nr:hypothetical protein [Flavobacteriales bacterium]
MKKTLLILATAAAAMTANAQIVALHSTSGTQIFKGNTALNTAYTAAQNGDTLYLSGGSFTPPSNFDKQLMIFGTGHYVDSTMATGKTFIQGGITLSDNADNTMIQGVDINGNLTFTANQAVDNVTVRFCRMNDFAATGSSNPSQNLSLINNAISGTVNLENVVNALIANSILGYFAANTNGHIIQNNIILSSYCSWGNCNFGSGNNNTFNNNIILHGTTNWGGNGNTFQNNVFVNAAPSYGTTFTALNNYTNIPQANIFVNQTGAAFDYSNNYHLQNPVTYLGTDGTQVGIYGGTFPYKEGAVPSNPHIQQKNIAPTTDSNGDLQIQIKVAAQEN